jgi:capsid protein
MFGFGKKSDVFDELYGPSSRRAAHAPAVDEPSHAPVLTSDHLAPYRYKFDDGSKFEGGFGFTELLLTDYWTLRQRSTQLFETNIYARGIVRRLITNEINTGLKLEATPEEALLGKEEDSLADWSENVENRFALWESDPRLCDQRERLTFGQLQAMARLEALVAGDVLVVLRQDQRTKLPRVQLISGNKIQQPPFMAGSDQSTTNKIQHGVETDSTGRQVAYWVTQDDGTAKRLPAYGEKSGRRLAWLLYGTDKRMDDVRGKPLLALVLQSLREIDRYRDATQRKALINSMIALFVKKTVDKPGTKPITGGAQRRGSVQTTDTSGATVRSFNFAEQIPGAVVEELQVGEEPTPFSTHGTDQAFGEFEAAILCGVAWSLELPPEILTLSFRNNYSASQAAINEFKMYLNRARTDFGENFCQYLYREWLLAETFNQKIDAPGLLDSWQDPSRYDEFGAWISSDWSGQIKPAVDLLKLVNGSAEMCNQGFATRERMTRELTGMKFSKVIKKLKRENEALAEANKALAPPKPAGPKPDAPAPVGPASSAPKALRGDVGLDAEGRHELDVADEEERLPN